MKNKLRKIRVENTDFFWSVIPDKDAPEKDYVFLRVWRVGLKKTPWLTVRYHFHNIWLFYGELMAISTAEEKEKADNLFQFKPLTPKNVADIIRQSIELLGEQYGSKLYDTPTSLYLDNDGKLKLNE